MRGGVLGSESRRDSGLDSALQATPNATLAASLSSYLAQAKRAAKILENISDEQRAKALESIASRIQRHAQNIYEANARDLACVEALSESGQGLSESMKSRLALSESKINAMADSVREIATLPFCSHKILRSWTNHAGLTISQVSVPLGVIGVIYESRPNVTSDVSALCLKSGNACVLKGGKEARHTNRAIYEAICLGLEECGLPKECVMLLDSDMLASLPEGNASEGKSEGELLRALTEQFVKMDSYVDLLIPRGGEGLIAWVKQNATIPIIKHDKGVCHTYIHKSADLDKALEIVLNAKLSYPAACNALECVLLDSEFFGADFKADSKADSEMDSESSFGARLIESLHKNGVGVMFESKELLQRYGNDNDGLADFTREWGELRANLKIVSGIDEALEHIARYGSGHSEAIVCEEEGVSERFLREVDAACVYVNASTRFSDGGEFGFGAEVGISTSKLHARGPMGIESLQSYKYQIHGSGQVRG